jgi:DNA ligase-associated metallophosphoesterase
VNKATIDIEIAGEAMQLHAMKAMFWPRNSTLFISDVHVGKVGHFRKNGIDLPAMSAKKNYWNLSALFDYYQPHHLVVIGDLTHSGANSEWHEFNDFMEQYPQLKKTVVIGNHDSASNQAFQALGFDAHPMLHLSPFTLIHEPPQTISDSSYSICGHIHPGIRLVGKAKSSLTLPCFFIGEQYAILPAFGAFTGYVPIRPGKKDRVVGISENELFLLGSKT